VGLRINDKRKPAFGITECGQEVDTWGVGLSVFRVLEHRGGKRCLLLKNSLNSRRYAKHAKKASRVAYTVRPISVFPGARRAPCSLNFWEMSEPKSLRPLTFSTQENNIDLSGSGRAVVGAAGVQLKMRDAAQWRSATTLAPFKPRAINL
jgi:hypothetical protein